MDCRRCETKPSFVNFGTEKDTRLNFRHVFAWRLHSESTGEMGFKNLREFPWFNSTQVSFAGVKSHSILLLQLSIIYVVCQKAFCFLEFIYLYTYISLSLY